MSLLLSLVNYEVLQQLPKELEEHKTINNKDGILDRVSTLCRLWYNAYAWKRKIQNTTSTRGRTILHQKSYCLSTSQARPMPTTDVVGGGLPSVTHLGCITDDRQTHSATRTCLTNTPRDAEPFLTLK